MFSNHLVKQVRSKRVLEQKLVLASTLKKRINLQKNTSVEFIFEGILFVPKYLKFLKFFEAIYFDSYFIWPKIFPYSKQEVGVLSLQFRGV